MAPVGSTTGSVRTLLKMLAARRIGLKSCQRCGVSARQKATPVVTPPTVVVTRARVRELPSSPRCAEPTANALTPPINPTSTDRCDGLESEKAVAVASKTISAPLSQRNFVSIFCAEVSYGE